MAKRSFSQRVLAWFDVYGRKDLPWQKRLTPYRVWVSEIMLQQTQVQTVIPYFERFMRLFPTVKQLALAEEDAVLGAWSGLGYYARARNLHRTAQIIQADYRGRFPKTREALESLPGIGRSTAAAICAICFDQVEAILDGNVKRVLARYHALDHPIESKAGLEQLWPFAESLVSKTRMRDYTQAMMDLGSMICTRTQPNCSVCPLKKTCQAYQRNAVTDYPVRAAKRKRLPVRETFMLIFQDPAKRFLLERRASRGIWGGLWCFPAVASLDLCEEFSKRYELVSEGQYYLPAFRHTFTHFHLDVQPIVLPLVEPQKKLVAGQCWYEANTALPGGIPKPVRLLLDEYFE